MIWMNRKDTVSAALLCGVLLMPSPMAAQAFEDFVPDVEFEPEDARGIPDHELDVDMSVVVDEILNQSARAKNDIFINFGEGYVAEVLRVLAAWRDQDASKAYQDLLAWNLEFFFNNGEQMQKRFVRTVAECWGDGAGRLRADLALAILQVLEEGQSDYAMLKSAEYLSSLLAGPEGADMILHLEAGPQKGQVRPLMAHVLIRDWNGERVVGEALGQLAIQVAQRVKGGDHFADDAVAEAQARLLGRAIADVDSAVEVWGETKDVGPQASAAHGASIVRFALDVLDTLLGQVSKAVTGPIRQGVDWLEEYETSQEPPPANPTGELRAQMLSAVVVPFHQLVTDDMSLLEEEIQVMVERFRRNVEEGRKSTWGV